MSLTQRGGTLDDVSTLQVGMNLQQHVTKRGESCDLDAPARLQRVKVMDENDSKEGTHLDALLVMLFKILDPESIQDRAQNLIRYLFVWYPANSQTAKPTEPP